MLQINLRAVGEHLTNQLSWVAAQLPVTRVCPIYLIEERCYSGVIYLLFRGWEAEEGAKVVSWEGGKGGGVVS